MPGGTIVIEDTDFAGSFCYPTCAAYERYKELYQELVERRGGDPNIGPKLPAMLRRAGIQGVELNVIQPAHIHGEGKLMAPITMSRISDALTAEGLATESEAAVDLNRIESRRRRLRDGDQFTEDLSGVGQARRLEQLQCLRRCIDDLAQCLA